MSDANPFELQPLRDWIESSRERIRRLGTVTGSWPHLDTVICPSVSHDDPAAAIFIENSGDLALVFFDLVEVVRQGDAAQTEELMGAFALTLLSLRDTPAFALEVRRHRKAPLEPDLSQLATELLRDARAAMVACVAAFEAGTLPSVGEG